MANVSERPSFEHVATSTIDDVIPVFKYKSKNTGLTIVIAEVDGPLVNGYYCLPTEALDDDGLPHTLEHLVFMGSEKYPFKGVLDLLANRSLASGTNAWTDTDHTCYTMTTAGSEGFLNLMPIYIDHILYPTLTEAGYITEVHHINGDGEDAGVVYCEMQSVQNTGENITRFAMLKEMYPGQCGYKSETGGDLTNLRDSTTHQKVVDYHKAFYRPDNLCLIITGQVDPQAVLAALEPVEKHIIAKLKAHPLKPYVRPWQSPVAPLLSTVEKWVKFPSDEDSTGMVLIGYRGPKSKEQYELSAIMMLMEYLTDSPVSILQKEFVEIPDPLCSNVTYSITENSVSYFRLKFKNVPVEKLKTIKDKYLGIMKRIGSTTTPIDMKRMTSVIHKRILEAQSSLEDNPHDSVAFHIIGNVLYADADKTEKDLENRLNQVAMFRKLKEEKVDYWVHAVNHYIVGHNYVCIIGEPSIEEMKAMGKKEKERIAKQRDILGPYGLNKRRYELDCANDENEKKPPESMLTCVKVPDVKCIKLHPITVSSNHKEKPLRGTPNPHFPVDKIPVTFQLDDLHSNFVRMRVLMNTTGLNKEQKMLLPLFSEAILESPIRRNGKLIPFTEVITELEMDTLENDCSIGIGGSRFFPGKYSSLLCLTLKVELEKYKKGVEWLRELMYHVRFTPERVRIIACKMANEVNAMKRNGTCVTRTLYKELLYNPESSEHIASMTRQDKFLTEFVRKLDKSQTPDVLIKDLEHIRKSVTSWGNIRVHVSCSCQKLAESLGESPAEVWINNFLPKDILEQQHKQKIVHVSPARFSLYPLDKGPARGAIVGVGSVESSFLITSTPSISNFKDHDIPAVLVFIQYITQLEGPMWKQIRGLGLAYHYRMFLNEEQGQLYFQLFKASHLVSAYKQAKNIVMGHISGKHAFSPVQFESCKSSLIFEIIEDEKTPGDASEQSLLSYLRGVDKDYHRVLIQTIPKVTLDDMHRVGPKYFSPLFDPAKCKMAICCHPTKVDSLFLEMQSLGQKLEVLESLEKSFLAKV